MKTRIVRGSVLTPLIQVIAMLGANIIFGLLIGCPEWMLLTMVVAKMVTIVILLIVWVISITINRDLLGSDITTEDANETLVGCSETGLHKLKYSTPEQLNPNGK